MEDVDEIVKERTEKTVKRLLDRSSDRTEPLIATMQYKLVGELSEAIKATGSDLFKAGTALKISIDDFRESSERTSKVLMWLTGVLGFATCVQAFYAVMLILKK